MIGSLLFRNIFLRNSLLRKSLRHISSNPENAFVPFDKLVSRRRLEAKRSLLVEVASFKSANDLYQECSNFGLIRNMFHFRRKIGRNTKEMILVEFVESEDLQRALENANFSPSSTIPTHSPFLWLAARNTSRPSGSQGDIDLCVPITYEREDDEIGLFTRLHQCKTVSQQIEVLYEDHKMTELGWRLRFFTCRQIEAVVSGLFPKASVLPFGSSVNSFGHRDCDLDMSLEFTDLNGCREISNSSESRLVFQDKKPRVTANPRITMQYHMEVVGDLLDNFAPGCFKVRKILSARIPIIKYFHELTSLECDLSMGNRSGFYMSELLYLYGCIDPRVRPLVFLIRSWARDRHLTSVQAGRWITNFSLTQLVLFYLTQTSPPVIPPFHILIKLAEPSDQREVDGTNCTFLRNLSLLAPSENKDSLEILLNGFFTFYDCFNFKERGLSLLTGIDFVKPEPMALYIQNPLEKQLNVSRNVTLEEMDRLKTELTTARYLLENSSPAEDWQSKPWGMLSLYSSHGFQLGHPVKLQSGNISIDWKDIFIKDSHKVNKSKKFDGPRIKEQTVSSTGEQNSENKIEKMNRVSLNHQEHSEENFEMKEVMQSIYVKKRKNKKRKKSKAHDNGKLMYRW